MDGRGKGTGKRSNRDALRGIVFPNVEGAGEPLNPGAGSLIGGGNTLQRRNAARRKVKRNETWGGDGVVVEHVAQRDQIEDVVGVKVGDHDAVKLPVVHVLP